MRVLELRVYGAPDSIGRTAEALEGLTGARHVTVLATDRGEGALVTADLTATAADHALGLLDALGIPPDSFVLNRIDTIGFTGGNESVAVVWADVLGQARERARAPFTYLALMAAAGVVAAFAVLNQSAVLIVGAMAISPDLLPVTAICTGLILRRTRLLARGTATLATGLAVTGAIAAILTVILGWADLLPNGFTLGEIPAAQTHVGASTILVALAAGVAGMLAVETRGSSAVGVAISVTTIPAVAYIGVAIGTGEFSRTPSALAVLGANVAMMLVGGSCALGIQRALSANR